ncbi:hypothetical protein L6452_10602 [Arctium lappa]|uniref:Uncharacterized protein n=1 Tax=Arctium lappa TaxID=4217 RepID=A0ACB9DNK8_ARCLA|nr:hypothetical protein L6452_10602 [Arctium lappa]
MDLNIDIRYLLLPLAHLLFPFSHFTAIIITLFLQFASIKLGIRFESPVVVFIRFQAIDLSVSVMICFMCLFFLSTRHFWILNPILILCSSHLDDLLFKLLEWLYRTLKAIRVLEFLCIFSGCHREEAPVADQQQELSWEPDHHIVDVNVDDELEDP